jgi:hypothetical protein
MLGFAPNLLMHMKQVAEGAYPAAKITAPGYLKMLLADKSPGVKIVNEGWDGDDGHFREMKVKYRTRGIEDNTTTSDTCDVDVIPVYSEADVSLRFYRQVGIVLDDATIARYLADASATVRVGKPATALMNETLGAIYEQLNGLFQGVDDDLLGVQAVNFGVNARTGSNASAAININKNADTYDLSDGLGRILADLVENEISGTPVIVGSGLFNNFDVQKFMASAASNGVNLSQFPYKFFFDKKTATKWGSNQIGVFEPGAVKLLHRNKYKGAFAGEKGTSFFFTMSPQVQDQFGDSLAPFTLDAQLKYYDCPTDITVSSYGGTRRISRGWALVVGAYYDQFNIPSDAYDSSDDLYQANGTLRYTISNDCENCA